MLVFLGILAFHNPGPKEDPELGPGSRIREMDLKLGLMGQPYSKVPP